MLDHFDKLILVDQVIPMLEKIKSREPAVLMAMLGMEVWSCCTYGHVRYGGVVLYLMMLNAIMVT